MDIQWLMADEDQCPPSMKIGERTAFDDARWRGEISFLQPRENLIAITTQAEVHDRVVVEPSNDQLTGSWASTNFMLSGRYDVTFADGYETVLTPDAASFLAMSDWRATYELAPEQSIQHFSLTLREDAMAAMLGGEIPDALRDLFTLKQRNIGSVVRPVAFTPRIRAIVRDVIQSPLRGALRKLEVEGAALQLIALMAHQAQGLSEEAEQGTLSTDQRKRVDEAYRILVGNLADPPGLGKLAQAVGLNDKVLNAGFKEVHGMTAFEVLREERMNVARHVLETEDIPLKQVAYRVGYSHASNFVTAFKARFGAPPRQYKKE